MFLENVTQVMCEQYRINFFGYSKTIPSEMFQWLLLTTRATHDICALVYSP